MTPALVALKDVVLILFYLLFWYCFTVWKRDLSVPLVIQYSFFVSIWARIMDIWSFVLPLLNVLSLNWIIPISAITKLYLHNFIWTIYFQLFLWFYSRFPFNGLKGSHVKKLNRLRIKMMCGCVFLQSGFICKLWCMQMQMLGEEGEGFVKTGVVIIYIG